MHTTHRRQMVEERVVKSSLVSSVKHVTTKESNRGGEKKSHPLKYSSESQETVSTVLVIPSAGMLTLLFMPLAGLHFCVGLDFVTPYPSL
jgi:hypothetical protein